MAGIKVKIGYITSIELEEILYNMKSKVERRLIMAFEKIRPY
jgi:hypothetical protein